MQTQCDGYCGSLLMEKKIGRCPALGRDSLRAAERDVREVWREASLPEHHCHVQRHTGNLCVVITAVHVTELLSHLSALLLSHPGRMVIRSCDHREQTMAKAGWGKWTNEKKKIKKNVCGGICDQELFKGFSNTHQVWRNVRNEGSLI